MKDNFSVKSAEYAKFIPNYPLGLYEFLQTIITGNEAAWDCGTGNGQVAIELAKIFKHVYATDISEQQLKNAIQKENITYSQQSAEDTDFDKKFFDLICVAQAIHWFDFEMFYSEVKRTLKPEGILAVMGYGLFKTDSETEKVILQLYNELTGPYWDPERRYLDENYATIPFPFQELKVPAFEQWLVWNFDQLTGYLKTWSAVKHYEKDNGENPVDLISEDLKKAFGTKGEVCFPILFRAGKLRGET